MLSFVLCDDNKSILERLAKMLNALFLKHQLDAEISLLSTEPKELLEYANSHIIDVFFLDIDLKSDISGLDVADIIRKNNKHSYIIFTSAHLEYILIAYKYKTFDFIPKPIATERLEETLLRLKEDLQSNIHTKQNSFIHLKHNNTIINQESVNYIKKDGMKLIFYTDSKTYETYSSFNKIEQELPTNFIRCHKSYIVNVDKIANVEMNCNTITFDTSNQQKCFVGPKYKNNFLEVLNNYGNFSNSLDSFNNTKC